MENFDKFNPDWNQARKHRNSSGIGYDNKLA